MDEHDPRHGTTAGAMKHYRDGETPCEPCRIAQNRAHKLNKYRRDNGDRGRIPHEEVKGLIEPWVIQGFSITSVYRAAGAPFHYGGNAYNKGRAVMRDTYKALLCLTDDDFLETDLVYADLTRCRIYSLRAAGHRLIDMPICPEGVWRTHERITVRDARAMRDHYRTNEAKLGSNKNGASRARNQGHRPPMAWDDPGTLAWPDGKPAKFWAAADRHGRAHDDLDPAVVERILAGDFTLTATTAERREVARRWPRALAELERETGWRPDRYVTRGGGAA